MYSHCTLSRQKKESEKRMVRERGREEARVGNGREAKAQGGQWGGSVVVAPSWREASEATNVVIIVSGLGYGFVGMGSGLLATVSLVLACGHT